MRSIASHQNVGRYTLARDEIQGRFAALDDIQPPPGLMIYQACGLDKQKQNISLPTNVLFLLERVMGVEPTSQPWEGRILPMKYTREFYSIIITNKLLKIKCFFAFFCWGWKNSIPYFSFFRAYRRFF